MRKIHVAYARSYPLFNILAAVATVLASFTLAVIRYSVGQTWHSLCSLGVMAYRVVGNLRPIYRESYDSHGLSLVECRKRR